MSEFSNVFHMFVHILHIWQSIIKSNWKFARFMSHLSFRKCMISQEIQISQNHRTNVMMKKRERFSNFTKKNIKCREILLRKFKIQLLHFSDVKEFNENWINVFYTIALSYFTRMFNAEYRYECRILIILAKRIRNCMKEETLQKIFRPHYPVSFVVESVFGTLWIGFVVIGSVFVFRV